MKLKWGVKSSLVVATLSGIAASLCCIGPLLLLLLGMGGAWLSTVTALAPLRPMMIIITLVFLGFTFWQLYFKRITCEQGKVCAIPRYLRIQRLIFWIVSILLLLIIAFPWYEYLLY